MYEGIDWRRIVQEEIEWLRRHKSAALQERARYLESYIKQDFEDRLVK